MILTAKKPSKALIPQTCTLCKWEIPLTTSALSTGNILLVYSVQIQFFQLEVMLINSMNNYFSKWYYYSFWTVRRNLESKHCFFLCSEQKWTEKDTAEFSYHLQLAKNLYTLLERDRYLKAKFALKFTSYRNPRNKHIQILNNTAVSYTKHNSNCCEALDIKPLHQTLK